MTLRGLAYSLAPAARWTMVFRLAAAPYGTQRSMMMSPVLENREMDRNFGIEERRRLLTWTRWCGWETFDDDRSWWNGQSSKLANDCLSSLRYGCLWWTFAENEWGWLRKSGSLLFDAKGWWWCWLRWTHFLDDEWLKKSEDKVRTILER